MHLSDDEKRLCVVIDTVEYPSNGCQAFTSHLYSMIPNQAIEMNTQKAYLVASHLTSHHHFHNRNLTSLQYPPSHRYRHPERQS